MDIKEKWYGYTWEWDQMKLANPRLQWMAIPHLQGMYDDCNVCTPQAESTPRNPEVGSAYRRPFSHWCPKKLRSGYGVLQLIFKLREVCSHENWYIYIMKNHVIGGCALNHGLERSMHVGKVCAQKCRTSVCGVGVPTFHG